MVRPPRPPRVPYLCGLAAILLLLLVRYHSPSESHIRIHDNLISNFPYYVLMAERPIFESLDATVPQIMGGVPKSALPSPLQLYGFAFRALPPLGAYIFNDVVARLVAFFGMALFLGAHVRPRLSDLSIAGASTCFALLDYWPIGFLTIMGLPMFFYALLRIAKGQKGIAQWILVGLYPFASSIVTVGWFLMPLCAGITLAISIRNRHLHARTLAATSLLTACYAIAEFPLIFQTFFRPAFVSHRIEFDAQWYDRTPTHSAWAFWKHVLEFSLNGSVDQAATLAYPFLGVALTVSIFVILLGVILGQQRTPPFALQCDFKRDEDGLPSHFRLGVALLGFILFAAFNWSVQQTYIFKNWMFNTDLGILSSIDTTRLAWLIPPAWYVLFALALEICRSLVFQNRNKAVRFGSAIALALVLLQVSTPNLLYYRSVKGGTLYGKRIPRFMAREWTYGEFFSPELFGEVKNFIGRPPQNYRVIAVGYQPSILTYNGFYTADGYLSNYSLEYKHRFRKLIYHELKENVNNRVFFDMWGNKCYALPSKVNRFSVMRGLTNRSKGVPGSIPMRLNAEAMNDLGIEYVISSIEIQNPADSEMVLLETFESEASPYTLYLYGADVDRPAEKKEGEPK